MRSLDYPWWLAARAAGITAYLLLSLSVTGGLLMALRRVPRRLRAAVRSAHERVALLALAFLGAHGLLLLGDPWLKASPGELLVPFSLGYRPFWTGLGVLAAYGTVALSLTYYARRSLGARRWRRAHRFIPVFWALSAAHAIGAGTDGGGAWLLAPVATTVALAAWLLADRWLAAPQARTPRRAPAAPPAPPPPPAPPAPVGVPPAAPPAARDERAAPATLWLGH